MRNNKPRTYNVNTICENCGDKSRYEIEYGKTIGWAICNYCGCGSLKYDDLSDHDSKATKQLSVVSKKI